VGGGGAIENEMGEYSEDKSTSQINIEHIK
jgi:hypothetical protein